jgi:MFS family permease
MGLRLNEFGGRVFALAALANFAHSMAFHSYLHLPGFLEGLGADEFEIGNIMAVAFLAAILVRPLVGRLMDEWGRRPVFLAGGVISILTAAGYLGVDSIGGALLGLRVTHGIAVGALFSVLFTIAADVVPSERRAQGLALFGVSGMFPLALGGLMGDWLLVDGDYGRLFWAIGVCALLGLLISLPIEETGTRGGGGRGGFLRVAAAPALRPLWVVGIAFAFALAAFFIFLKTWVLELGEGSLGEVFAWYAGVAIALRVFFGHLPERFGLKRVLFPALLVTTAGLATLGFADSSFDLNVAGVLCGAGHGFAFPIISALVVQRADPNQRGSAVAMFTALFDLGALVAGPSLGFVARDAGYPIMFALAAVTCLAATLLFALIDRKAA